MNLNIQLNLTRWFRPRIHVFSIITWLRLNNNNKSALTCYNVFIIWLIGGFAHYAFIKQNVIYSGASRLWKVRHTPTHKWLIWLVPDWTGFYGQRSTWKLSVFLAVSSSTCFLLFSKLHGLYLLPSLTEALPTLSLPSVSAAVVVGLPLKYHLLWSNESSPSEARTAFRGVRWYLRERWIQ